MLCKEIILDALSGGKKFVRVANSILAPVFNQLKTF